MPSGRLTAKESLILWGGIIGVAFVFFILGLWLGMKERELTPADIQSSSRQPAPQSEKRLVPATPVEPVAEGLNARPSGSASSTSREAAPAGGASTKATRPLTIQVEPPPKRTAAAQPATTPAALPSTTPATTAAPTAGRSAGLFTIQLGALKTEAEARRLVAQLKQKGYTGIIDMPAGRDTYYRVRVGGYATRDAAIKAEALLKSEGFSTFVKRIERRSTN